MENNNPTFEPSFAKTLPSNSVGSRRNAAVTPARQSRPYSQSKGDYDLFPGLTRDLAAQFRALWCNKPH